MAAISDFLENELIDHVLRNAAYTSPVTVYLALFTDDPTDADTGTEVSGGSYARQSVAFDAPTNGTTQNSATITFPTATADWGLITHAGIYDAVSVGNLLFHAKLALSQQVLNTETFSEATGQLVVSLT